MLRATKVSLPRMWKHRGPMESERVGRRIGLPRLVARDGQAPPSLFLTPPSAPLGFSIKSSSVEGDGQRISDEWLELHAGH